MVLQFIRNIFTKKSTFGEQNVKDLLHLCLEHKDRDNSIFLEKIRPKLEEILGDEYTHLLLKYHFNEFKLLIPTQEHYDSMGKMAIYEFKNELKVLKEKIRIQKESYEITKKIDQIGEMLDKV